MAKQQLDDIRTLAIKLFEAGESVKRKHPNAWPGPQEWRHLPSESVEMWDAIAICAYKKLRPSK